MYSLYNKTSFQKFLQITTNNKFRILVILISILFGFLTSNVFAADSLRLTDNTIVRNLFPKTPKVYFTGKYDFNDSNSVHLKMSYGSNKILNPKSLIDTNRDKRPREVNLVMTLYPSNLENWREDFKDLIASRIESLYELDSAFFYDKGIKWNLIIQDEDVNLYQAKKKNHGVVVNYTLLPTIKHKERYKIIYQAFVSAMFSSSVILERKGVKLLIIPGFHNISGIVGTLSDASSNEFDSEETMGLFYTKTADSRYNHLTERNHKALADKVVKYFTAGEMIDLTTGFETSIYTKNNI